MRLYVMGLQHKHVLIGDRFSLQFDPAANATRPSFRRASAASVSHANGLRDVVCRVQEQPPQPQLPVCTLLVFPAPCVHVPAVPGARAEVPL